MSRVMRELSHSQSTSVQHVKWDQVPSEALSPLFERQFVVGEHMMVARVLLKKGCVVPTHSHMNEQLTHIQSGALQFTIEGQEITVRPGEWLVIPPNVPHSAVALEDTVDIDVFTPPREDWIHKTDQYLRNR